MPSFPIRRLWASAIRCHGVENIIFRKTTRRLLDGSSLADRAQKVATRLAGRRPLMGASERWDVRVLVVEQADFRLKETIKRPGNLLGSDPYFYLALVQVELTLQGIAVKLARTVADANAFVSTCVAVLGKCSPRAK